MSALVPVPPEPPAPSEPISLTLAKSHLRVDITDDDALIGAYITAAREIVEAHTRRTWVSRTYDYFLDDFPRGTPPLPALGTNLFYTGIGFDPPKIDLAIKLPQPKVTAVASVKYYDADGALQTLDTAAYQTDLASQPARVLPTANPPIWPVTQANRLNAVVIRFTAGDAVPQAVVQAMLLLVGDFYANREGDSVGFRLGNLPPAVLALLGPYRTVRLP